MKFDEILINCGVFSTEQHIKISSNKNYSRRMTKSKMLVLENTNVHQIIAEIQIQMQIQMFATNVHQIIAQIQFGEKLKCYISSLELILFGNFEC